MTTIKHNTMKPQLIATSKLVKSPLNVRRTAPTVGMDELKASILLHGLMQNLVVTQDDDGLFHVIAGGRRLDAIRLLQADGLLPEDYSVACHIVTDEHATEMSLAENIVRVAMHPADEFEAFASLIDHGHSTAQVAERFGVDESHVYKRMKLARVASKLVSEYRNGNITLECLMAFTVTDDHRWQLKVYKSLTHWQKDDPAAIRAALTEKLLEAGNKLVRFVGIDAYMSAGGSTRADLFGEEVYLEKPAILHRLVQEKLATIQKELEPEGWGWIEINPERDYEFIYRCERIKPQPVEAPTELVEFRTQLKAELADIERALEDTESDTLLEQQELTQQRLNEVDEQLAAYVGFDTEQKAIAGCYVSIDQHGTAFIEKGLVKREHRKQLFRLLGTDTNRDGTVRTKHAMPESLRRDLALSRLLIARIEIAQHPLIAFDLMVFQEVSEKLGNVYSSDGPNVKFIRSNSGSDNESTMATDGFEAVKQSLPLQWMEPEFESFRFAAFCLLPMDEKLRLLAYCVALTLQPNLGPIAGDEVSAYDIALARTGADLADYWRPTASNYFSRRTRDQLLAIARETMGEKWAHARSDFKKMSLVDQLDRIFADPDGEGISPEQTARLKRWLPDSMSFTLASEPIDGVIAA